MFTHCIDGFCEAAMIVAYKLINSHHKALIKICIDLPKGCIDLESKIKTYSTEDPLDKYTNTLHL